MSDFYEQLPGLGLLAVFVWLPMNAAAFDMADVLGGDFKFSIGGYAKMSAMWTDTDSGSLAGGATGTGRTFFVPSSIPTGGSGGDSVFAAFLIYLKFSISRKSFSRMWMNLNH